MQCADQSLTSNQQVACLDAQAGVEFPQLVTNPPDSWPAFTAYMHTGFAVGIPLALITMLMLMVHGEKEGEWGAFVMFPAAFLAGLCVLAVGVLFWPLVLPLALLFGVRAFTRPKEPRPVYYAPAAKPTEPRRPY